MLISSPLRNKIKSINQSVNLSQAFFFFLNSRLESLYQLAVKQGREKKTKRHTQKRQRERKKSMTCARAAEYVSHSRGVESVGLQETPSTGAFCNALYVESLSSLSVRLSGGQDCRLHCGLL